MKRRCPFCVIVLFSIIYSIMNLDGKRYLRIRNHFCQKNCMSSATDAALCHDWLSWEVIYFAENGGMMMRIVWRLIDD